MYRNDPRWMEARFTGTCDRCKGTIKRRDRMFYYPLGRVTLCAGENCGKDAARDFAAAVADEGY